MSAVEKLRALELRPDGWETLRFALPQIVAVVEATEIARSATWQPHGKSMWEIEQLLNEIRDSADAALAALDEHLGDFGSATESETPSPQ